MQVIIESLEIIEMIVITLSGIGLITFLIASVTLYAEDTLFLLFLICLLCQMKVQFLNFHRLN